MPMYHRLGEVPPKRHTQFRRPDGALYTEELFGTAGFSGPSSILYHHYLPTAVRAVETLAADLRPAPWPQDVYRHHHLRSKEMPRAGDPLNGRQVLLYNAEVAISLACPTEPMDYYYRNGQADELIFVHEGLGLLQSTFGNMPFRAGDYLVVPRGTTYRLSAVEPCRFLVVEAAGPIETPRRYRNEFGQLLEHSPYCERDIRRPMELAPRLERGDYEVRVKVADRLTSFHLEHHPCDVVGWDGYLYPWILNIADFEPITGRIHQPPPVHQTFQGPGFVVCSFVPRRLDYHPEAVPIPYNHSNIDSDEVLYYVTGNFSSRRGIEVASFTLHPRGIPHGPQPGLVEGSLGKESTDELAVMIDTFRPLHLAEGARALDDPAYPFGWSEG